MEKYIKFICILEQLLRMNRVLRFELVISVKMHNLEINNREGSGLGKSLY